MRYILVAIFLMLSALYTAIKPKGFDLGSVVALFAHLLIIAEFIFGNRSMEE